MATLEQQDLSTILGRPHPLIVAIGSKATRTALDQGGDSALLSIFIPKNAYDALQVPALNTNQRSLSVIYLDQPLNRIVSLATLLEPRATRFGTVFGPISRESEADLKALTNARGITLKQSYLNHEDNPLAILRPLVKEADVFIALPDQAILNRAIAKWILHLSFQQTVPVIGFSKAYTNAGALASIYSAPEDIGKQAGEFVRNWLSNPNQRDAQEQYPRYFTISTNPAVARSLNINLPPDNQLYRAIEQQEQTAP
ncbi:MAG: ABC transporter substrate binding protein [Porticoccaceae bacterium]